MGLFNEVEMIIYEAFLELIPMGSFDYDNLKKFI
jgi:hypothetical protein